MLSRSPGRRKRREQSGGAVASQQLAGNIPARGSDRLRGLPDRTAAVGFVAPAMLVLIVMNVLPILWSFGMSFYAFRADRPHTPPRFVGLGNYVYMALNDDVWEHAQNTAVLMACSVLVQVAVGGRLKDETTTAAP